MQKSILFRNILGFSTKFIIIIYILSSQIFLSGIFFDDKTQSLSLKTNIAQADNSVAWYNSSWHYRKEITINHANVVGEDLTNYPLLFSATDNDFKSPVNGGNVGKENGGDILFTLSDGTTKLSHELEGYTANTGKVSSWIKIPSLSHTNDTKIYIYYGNVAATDQQNKNNVWDANYKMVQHLNETPANGAPNGHLDSTTNAMNGTADLFYSTATTNADGKIAGADIFKDYSYYSSYPDYADIHKYSRITLPSSVLSSEESFTLSSWVKPNASGAVLSNNGGEADYCTAPGNPSYAYFLRNVTFNTINNNTSNPYDSVAYRDYTNLSTTVNVGQTYVLYTTNAPYQNHWIKAWIDYNQDGDFSDVGEAYTITVNNSYQVGQQVSIPIPTTALNGPTRLRVRATGWSEPPACGYDWGTETEDYTVNIQGSAFSKNNVFSFGTFGAGNVGKFTILKNGVAYNALGDANINDNAWHYLSATYDASGMKIYVDGILKGTNNTITGAINPLGGGFWIGRYYDDRIGQYGFDGTIDEVRVSTSARNANWIRTEYNNQNSPGTFLALASEEPMIMDHLQLSTSAAAIAAGEDVPVTINAINSVGNIYLDYTNDKNITFSGATVIGSHAPTFTDKNGDAVAFGSAGAIAFTNGVAHTTLKLYMNESVEIEAGDGTYGSIGNSAYDLNSDISSDILDSFDIVSHDRITSESPFSISLTAKDIYGNITPDVTNSTTLSLDSGKIDPTLLPAAIFQDDGVYLGDVTVSEVYSDKDVILSINNGSVVNTKSLTVTGVSHGTGFIAPVKPSVTDVHVFVSSDGNLGTSNIPAGIAQIAVSTTPDFKNISWEDIANKDDILKRYVSAGKLYMKFRSKDGAVSDVIIYETNANSGSSNSGGSNGIDANNPITLNDGDIIKTPGSPDVYIVKNKNNKQYKRLVLSPSVFKSYGHLKWSNLKTVSRQQIDKFVTSGFVKVARDPSIYELSPLGDTGNRKALDTNNSYDMDSVYEINSVDRDSYELSR